jgi:drug/metabolite transporter (DMT)-like permease
LVTYYDARDVLPATITLQLLGVIWQLKLAYFVAILNAAVIGVTFLLVKLTLTFATPLDTLTYRFAVAFAVMIVPAIFGFFKLGYRGKPLFSLLLLASLYPIAYFVLQTYGLQHAASAEGGIISAMTPAVTMIFASVFLKETTTLMQKLSLLLSASGIVFIYTMNGASDWSRTTGIALLVLACVTLAGYNVLARLVTRHFSAMEISFFMVGVAFVSFLTASLGIHAAAGTIDTFVAPLSSGVFIALISCLGLIQVATAYMANFVLSRMEAAKMSVFSHLSTIIAIGAGALILQESVTWSHLCGAVLIISGVIGVNMPWNVSSTSAKQLKKTSKARS